jgi:hypothetical protein
MLGASITTGSAGSTLLMGPGPQPAGETNSPDPTNEVVGPDGLIFSDIHESPDPHFLKIISRLRILTIFEEIATTTSALVAYFSFILLINSIRNFPAIEAEINRELVEKIWYRCQLDPEIRWVLGLEAATVSTEAVGYTTSLAGLALLLITMCGVYHLFKMSYNYREKFNLDYFFKEHNIELSQSLWKYNLSRQDMRKLHNTIATHHENKVLIHALMNIYFEPLNHQELKALTETIDNHQLKHQILKLLNIRPSPFRKWIDQSQWYGNELARYRLPVAAIFAIPGGILMYHGANYIGSRINCDISTLIFDTCDVSKQYDMLAEQIKIWMPVSFSVIFLSSFGMVLNLIIQHPVFKPYRTAFYERWHKPYAKWLDDKNWLYKRVGLEIVGVALRPAIIFYSFTKAVSLANRYAQAVGCGSLWQVLTDFNPASDSVCDPGSKGLVTGGFVADFEIAKLYFFFMLLKAVTYTIVHFLEHCTHLRRRYPIAYVNKLYEKFCSIEKRSLEFALTPLLLIPLGLAMFFTAKTFAEEMLHKGLSSYYEPGFPININISSITNTTVLQDICPFDNLTAIILQLNTTALPFNIIDNHIVEFPISRPRPDLDIFAIYFNNFLSPGNDILLEKRSLAFFVSVFWMLFSLYAGGMYYVGNNVQLAGWGLHKISHYLFGEEVENPEAQTPMEIELEHEEEQKVPSDIDSYLVPAPSPHRDRRQERGCFSRIYRFFAPGEEKEAFDLPAISPQQRFSSLGGSH